jgi:hypothetical protein
MLLCSSPACCALSVMLLQFYTCTIHRYTTNVHNALHQINQNDAVYDLASKLLDNWDMRKTYKRDIILSLAVARCNIARDLLADQKVRQQQGKQAATAGSSSRQQQQQV